MAMGTPLEIFSNPWDLYISIQEIDGRQSIAICRGQGHRYKPLITSNTDPRSTFENKEKAIAVIRDQLSGIQQRVTKELLDSTSVAYRLLNPDGENLDETQILTPELIDRIVSELEKNQSVETESLRVVIA